MNFLNCLGLFFVGMLMTPFVIYIGAKLAAYGSCVGRMKFRRQYPLEVSEEKEHE